MNPRCGRSVRAVLCAACVLALSLAAGEPAPAPAPAPERPNILILLADDLGWSDLGCYGGEIPTPHLDALAAGGLRFTQVYNSSRCCPSRASLLTGLYPHQTGIGWFVGGGGKLPGHKGRLQPHCLTLAEALKPAGYAAYAAGKWHVNEPGPVERGFDEFYGFVHGYGVDSFNPGMMIRLPAGRPQRSYAPGTYFAANAIADHALDFLNLARGKKQPWLLYIGFQAAHFPVQCPPGTAERFVETYARGWDVLRAERLARMKKLGLLPDTLELPPRGPIDTPAVARRLGSMTADGLNPPWASLPADRRADLARRMAVYAAMVENMDANVGRLVADLKAHGELERTLILFLSDNGACAEWEPFGFDLDPERFRAPKPGRGVDGATPGMPNRLRTGAELAAMGGPETLFSYGCAWANLSNTPLSNYKHSAHEGGIRTPLIAHWPARIADAGALRSQLTHVMDVMATCVDLAGAAYPAEHRGQPLLPLEGRSLLPALLNTPEQPRTLIMEHEHAAMIRRGDWKLVGRIGKDGPRPGEPWQLFNVREDPAEQRDRAAENPALAAELLQAFTAEARRTLVLPAP